MFLKVCLIILRSFTVIFLRFDRLRIIYNSQILACKQKQRCGWPGLIKDNVTDVGGVEILNIGGWGNVLLSVTRGHRDQWYGVNFLFSTPDNAKSDFFTDTVFTSCLILFLSVLTRSGSSHRQARLLTAYELFFIAFKMHWRTPLKRAPSHIDRTSINSH